MPVYLDYNATAPLMPEAREAMNASWQFPANASSVHALGRNAKRDLEDARASIAQQINVFANEIIFTASGTEANALALNGFPGRTVLVSATEHVSVLQACPDAIMIPVDRNGIVVLAKLKGLLESQMVKPMLVSVMLANNETGVIQPIHDIVELSHRYGALVHTDAAQAIGRIPVDFNMLGVDLLSFCGHKFGGPVGVGVLALRQDMSIQPLLRGGRQELGRRAGTENISAIMGLNAALNASTTTEKPWRQWLDVMEAQLSNLPNVVVHGQAVDRLPNTSCISIPGLKSELQLMALDLAGFAVSSGSACSSGKVGPSHVLAAMGVDAGTAESAVRVSIGWNTTQQEVEQFTECWMTYCLRRQPAKAA